ncbi:hypothetical protein C8Q77DRAFT_356739 [Trametes polyzona]|nr:hypothetical protein C8Q77DRAFT_356739 [Trametes polyzona]
MATSREDKRQATLHPNRRSTSTVRMLERLVTDGGHMNRHTMAFSGFLAFIAVARALRADGPMCTTPPSGHSARHALVSTQRSAARYVHHISYRLYCFQAMS